MRNKFATAVVADIAHVVAFLLLPHCFYKWLTSKEKLIFTNSTQTVLFLAPPAPQPAGIMNNGAKDVTKDIQKLQQQLQDIKDQVSIVNSC